MMHLFKRLTTLFLLFLVAGLFYLEYAKRFTELAQEATDDFLTLAVVADLSGPSAFTGRSHVNGVRLLVDQFNRQGGLNGVHIKLKAFDDRNDKAISPKVAQAIADDPTVIGVIGHNYSSASLAAAPIYHREGVPAITPSSSNPKVTLESPWYFRSVIQSDLEAELSVYYIKAILGSDQVCVIYEDLPYGVDLANVFKAKVEELDMHLSCDIQFQTKSPSLADDLKGIVSDLKRRQGKLGIIYLATHVGEGSILVREMKEQGLGNRIFAPSSFYNHSFMTAFDDLPKEQASPGFYTEGVLVTSPLLFDTANRAAQEFKVIYEEAFGSKPGWHAAFSYDSAKIMLEAARSAGIGSGNRPIDQVRTAIREALNRIDSRDVAVQGITGATFFNNVGDAFKPIFVAEFKRNQPLSAFTQLQQAPMLPNAERLRQYAREGRLLEISGHYLQETHVVQTGVSINKVDQLDEEEVTYLLDFFIWFRHTDAVDPTDIEFVNALEVIDLGEPVVKQVNGNQVYQLYRVQARFRGDFVSLPHSIGRHVLGLAFYHKSQERHRLVFVTDILGMGLIDSDSLAKQLEEGQVLPPGRKLKVFSALVYQNIAARTSLGQGRYVTDRDGLVDFSRFNLAFTVGEHHVSLRRDLPVNSFWLTVGASILLLILPFMARRTGKSEIMSSLLWWTTALGLFSLLLAAELVALRYFAMDNEYDQGLIVVVFDVLWWLVPAGLLVAATYTFIWERLERRTGRMVPNLVKVFTGLVILVLACFGILSFVLGYKITALLATSGVVAMIVGLAVQMNISNIFSGIAINVERPFRIGDWIKVDDNIEGRVTDITWRSTRMKTRYETLVSIPNSVASESVVTNFSGLQEFYTEKLTVSTDATNSPLYVQKVLLDAVLATRGVMAEPPPISELDGFDESQATYSVVFYFDDFNDKEHLSRRVWLSIWNHLHWAGLGPNQDQQILEKYLRDLPVFRPFLGEELHAVAKSIRMHRYLGGEAVFRAGDQGDSLFIVREGVLSVYGHRGKESIELARLGAGACFGESALVTGEARSADVVALTDTTLYEITKEEIKTLIADRPVVMKHFAHIFSERQQNHKDKLDEKEQSIEEQPQHFPGSINNFSGL
jgi:branched-chain amino acid transport system substrate-binding protein